MFCPKCKSEYREGFTLCSSSNVPLINEDPRQAEHEFMKFVTASRKMWKKTIYDGGVLREEYIDQNYDGTFDLKVIYDSSGRPINTYSLH